MPPETLRWNDTPELHIQKLTPNYCQNNDNQPEDIFSSYQTFHMELNYHAEISFCL